MLRVIKGGLPITIAADEVQVLVSIGQAPQGIPLYSLSKWGIRRVNALKKRGLVRGIYDRPDFAFELTPLGRVAFEAFDTEEDDGWNPDFLQVRDHEKVVIVEAPNDDED